MRRNFNSKRRTKIVCTIGPATDSESMLERLAREGMDCARLNFSHGEVTWHLKVIESLRSIGKKTGIQIAVMQDLPGPKFRVGDIKGGLVNLKKNSIVTLTTKRVEGGPELIPLRAQDLPRYVKEGGEIFLSDGSIRLKIIEVKKSEIRCRCEIGGMLLSGKGVNVPELKRGFETFTQKDRGFLGFGLRHGVDLVAVSFVRKASDIESVKNFAGRRKRKVSIFAKIEKREALSNIDEIIEVSDGLMVARGDLGVENPIEQVPELQKEIISACNAKGVPVITATQMLESMVNNASPTRAEVTDVANAIFDGTDALMLSEETAVGKYPLECVRTMTNVALRAEAKLRDRKDFGTQEFLSSESVIDAISAAASNISSSIHAKAIITKVSNLGTISKISRFRPNAPIFSIADTWEEYRGMKIIWGVFPTKMKSKEGVDSTFLSTVRELDKNGELGIGDKVVMIHDNPLSSRHSGVTIKTMELTRM